MPGTIHVLGAGLAGLSAAVSLSGHERRVVVHEAAGHAGGRCRSFYDDSVGAAIDNGNHLVLSGNTAVRSYLDAIGAHDAMEVPERAQFPFLDLATGTRWAIEPDAGRVPWSLLTAAGRVPGASLLDYVKCWKLIGAADASTVGQCLATDGPLWDRFWAPLIVSIMNTRPEDASAALIWRVLKETFGAGEAACRPMLARRGLSAAFVEPAIDHVRAQGGEVVFNQRVRALSFEDKRLTALEFSGETIELGPADAVISALPAAVAADLIPGLSAPSVFSPIVNGHFRLPAGAAAQPFLGLVNGSAEWLFARDGIVSVTVSAADALAAEPAEAVARALWSDVAKAFELGNANLPDHRIIKEKRATFLQTPDQVGRRPGCRTRWQNLYLAGDWTETGLPATIEGTIRSGFTAASAAAGVGSCLKM